MARTYPALDLRWTTPPESDTVDRMLAAIDDDGPTAVEHHDDGIRVFFPSARDRDRAAMRVSDVTPTPSCQPIDVPDDDWAARSQASLGPVTVGRIIVTPPWARGQGRLFCAGEIEIVIRPSTGFGTGHHASTRTCLTLLQRLDVNAKRVLDVGTGSGVLALAAACLGAGAVLAVDADPDALTAAAENVQLNDMAGRINLRQFDLSTDLLQPTDQFDVVLANLTGALLIRHAGTLGRLTAPEGCLAAGGFERSEADAVHAAFVAAGWHQAQRVDEDGWTAFALTSSPIRSTTH